MSVSNLKNTRNAQESEKGFTLIELSIVLVIIGLIVGGILTGQDLIKAAEQRATLAQVEKYNTAVNTFRNKFGGIPGDLAAASASNFGISGGITFTGATGIGDGNGILEGASANATIFTGEPAMFWMEISIAGLVDGSFVPAADITTAGVTTATSATIPVSTYLPIAKLARGNYFTVASASGTNYYVLSGITAISGAGAYTSTNNLNALESYSMDKKVDDGLPTTGSVQALDVATTALNTAAGITTNAVSGTDANCVTATPAYNVVATTGSTPSCTLRFKFN